MINQEMDTKLGRLNKKESRLIKIKYAFTLLIHKFIRKNSNNNKKKPFKHKMNKKDNHFTIDSKFHSKRKYDGFSDEEIRTNAQNLGARNIKQLNQIKMFNAPDYDTVKKIISGNFRNYEQMLLAESKGATNETQMIFINKYKAPNLKTALNIEKGGFQDYQQYKVALEKGASNLEELKLLESYHAPDFKTVPLIEEGEFKNFEELQKAQNKGAHNKKQLQMEEQMKVSSYQEVKSILDTGFQDIKTYRLALSKGFQNYTDWNNYLLTREENLLHYKNMRKDIKIDQLMKEFIITDIYELLSLLETKYVPLMGDKALFSFDYELYKNKGYTEFQLNDLIGLDKDNDICAICLKELNGPTGTCPKCNEKGHYDCLSTWVIDKHSCPTCRTNLTITSIILSETKNRTKNHVKCILCKKIINPLERIIRCNTCFTTYHEGEFLEYIKIKGKCLVCNEIMKL